MRALPVGTALAVHLDQSKIDAELELFAAVITENLSYFYLTGFVGPTFQEIFEIKTHKFMFQRGDGLENTLFFCQCEVLGLVFLSNHCALIFHRFLFDSEVFSVQLFNPPQVIVR